MKVTAALLNKHDDNALERVLDVLNMYGNEKSSYFGIVAPTKSVFDKSLESLRRQSPNSSALIGCVSSKAMTANGYEFLQLDDKTLVFQGKIYSPVPETAAIQQLAKEPKHCETLLQTLVEKSDGDYAFFMLMKDSIAAARDPVGVQPLYYGENQELLAFATNRTALWKLGIENQSSFPPGNIGFLNRHGAQFKAVKTLNYQEPKPITMDDAAQKLQTLLSESIKRRTHGLREVAVAFSGGLDSSVVALLASRLGLKVNLLHVSMENQIETEEAIVTSDALNLPLEVHLFKDSDVEQTLPKVVALIEESDPIKAGVGLPFYWAAQKAAESGSHVLLAGQGADELFGGYQRYVNEYCKVGKQEVLRTIFNDVVNIHTSNLERDLKITGHLNVELRLPFASFDIAEFALSLPIECKMEPNPDTLRKLVLRKVAQNAGMPAFVVNKPKKAVQYSTGVNDAMKRLAKKHDRTIKEYVNQLFEASKL